MTETNKTELEQLKAKADELKVSYHPSISATKLREKLAAVNALGEVVATTAPVEQDLSRQRREASRLVRIRVTCMNPVKNEWPGEIFTTGNDVVGTFKKYVPFNADEGWHVPHIIYEMIRDRQCQVFTTTKTKNGIGVRQGKLIKEFAVEVLPDLTEAELAELAQRQAMAKAVD